MYLCSRPTSVSHWARCLLCRTWIVNRPTEVTKKINSYSLNWVNYYFSLQLLRGSIQYTADPLAGMQANYCNGENPNTNPKGVFIATHQLNWTQLNWSVEQRTAKSVVFLFMTSWPTNWVNWVIDRWQLFTLWTCRQLDVELSSVELSCVAINGPLHEGRLCGMHWW